MTAAIPAALRRSLRDTFGIDALRNDQKDVIARVLQGLDTLAIMPTGAGKSLCYQLPALHLEAATVVVSPLIALMKDQADHLIAAGVGVEQLNSARPADEQQSSLARIAGAEAGVVFATPERMTDPTFLDTLRAGGVSLVVIDEAHCISQWGHDFRPAYLELGAALARLGKPTVLALTATAPPDVAEDIRQRLGRPAMQVVHTDLYRANLCLRTLQVTNEEEHERRLVETLHGLARPGIVYCATVKACAAVHARLVAEGEAATLYHGRLPAAERNANQDRFMRGDAGVMVATPAFGMGIDKPDIRFVVHYQMPGSPQAYYQEAGRAGRDGAPADCVLIFHRRDRQVQQFFLAKKHPDEAELQAVLDAIPAAPEAISTKDLAQSLDVSLHRLAIQLPLLREGGLVRNDRRRRWKRVATKTSEGPSADSSEALQALAHMHEAHSERDRAALERMVFYARTGFCRWRVLLEGLGETAPFGMACGHCDNCLRPAPEPAKEPVPDGLHRPSPRRMPPAAFDVEERVRVPRHGEGRVRSATAEEVTVVFPDGVERTFVAQYVSRLAASSRRRAGA